MMAEGLRFQGIPRKKHRKPLENLVIMRIHCLSSWLVGWVGIAMAASLVLSGSAWAESGSLAGQHGSEELVSSEGQASEDDLTAVGTLRCYTMPLGGNQSLRKKPIPEPLAGSFSARCVSIKDGDTLIVKHNGALVTIDLNAIDAPELSQNFGIEAKLALSNVVLGHNLRIYPTKRDTAGKIHAWVLKGTTEINRHQVQSGFAWWSSSQAPTEIEISALQNKARAARLGLWSNTAPTPPWAWRKRQAALRRSLAI